jgi:hypothetical protein
MLAKTKHDLVARSIKNPLLKMCPNISIKMNDGSSSLLTASRIPTRRHHPPARMRRLAKLVDDLPNWT